MEPKEKIPRKKLQAKRNKTKEWVIISGISSNIRGWYFEL